MSDLHVGEDESNEDTSTRKDWKKTVFIYSVICFYQTLLIVCFHSHLRFL